MQGSGISILLLSSSLVVVAQPCRAVEADGSSRGVQLEEVIVTSQRRPEALLEVPATVQVVSGERLEKSNIQSSLDLTRLTPGVSLDPRGSYAQPTIRGVGTQITQAGSAANVAIYLDGIYQISQRGNFFDLGAVDQIQVMKGPQGTLYGRNATGGAILITTKSPSFQGSGVLRGSYGSLGDFRASMYVTGPLTDQLAANLSASYHVNKGYVRNLISGSRLNDFDDTVLRGKLLYKPSEYFEYLLTFEHTHLNQPATFSNSFFNGNYQGKRNTPGILVPTDRGDSAYTFDPVAKTRSDAVVGRGVIHLPGADITSYSGYRKTSAYTVTDTDSGPAALGKLEWRQSETQYSQEVNIASTGSRRLKYVSGVIYIDERGGVDPYISNDRLQTIGELRTKSFSGFLDLTYNLTERLSIIAGARYTSDRTHYTAERFIAPGIGTVDAKQKSSVTTPRLGARYEINDSTNVYVNYNEGFKSGSFNLSAANLQQAPPYNPEKIKAYEVGLKTRLWGRVSFELAGYKYDYKDIQITAARPKTVTNVSVGSYVYNAAAGEIYGAEGTLIAALRSDLKINLGVAYTHAEYTSFPDALITQPIVTGCGAGVVPPCGNTQFTADVTGNRMVRAPRLTASMGFDYDHALPSGMLEVAGNVYYSSGFYAEPGNRLRQSPYGVLDGTISYTPDGSKLRYSVWGRNLTNTLYRYNFIDTAVYDTQRFAPPRTYGVAIEVKY